MQESADDINKYLKEPLVATATIKEAGGYMQFWHQALSTRPHLVRMASDYCSAPGEFPKTFELLHAINTIFSCSATSVDAKRAFSTGRRQVNFMQTNMNSQTFKAQMAIGSWARSPLFPGLKAAENIIKRDIERSEDPFRV